MKLTDIAHIQSLSDATKPLLVVSRLIGLNPKSNWHKVYTIFVILCVLSSIGFVWHYCIRMNFKYQYLNAFVYILEETCRTTSLLVILGSSLFDRKRFSVPIKDFASIDQSLNSLNAFIDNSSTYRSQILLVSYVGLILLLFGPVKFSLNILPKIDNESWRIYVMGWSYTLIIIIVCTVVDCSYLSTLSIIRERFKKINWIIDRHVRKHGSYLRVNFLAVARKYAVNDVTRDLRILRKQYHDLWGIANRINEGYGLHLLVGAMTSLALITSKLWTSYVILTDHDGSNSRSLIESIIWVMFYVKRIFLLVNATESTVVAARTTYVVLQELEMKSDYNDCAMNGEIKKFLTQLQFEVRKFTACGFFDIDSTLIFGILGAACTYLVILIQMPTNTYVKTDHFNDSIHSNMDEDNQ